MVGVVKGVSGERGGPRGGSPVHLGTPPSGFAAAAEVGLPAMGYDAIYTFLTNGRLNLLLPPNNVSTPCQEAEFACRVYDPHEHSWDFRRHFSQSKETANSTSHVLHCQWRLQVVVPETSTPSRPSENHMLVHIWYVEYVMKSSNFMSMQWRTPSKELRVQSKGYEFFRSPISWSA